MSPSTELRRGRMLALPILFVLITSVATSLSAIAEPIQYDMDKRVIVAYENNNDLTMLIEKIEEYGGTVRNFDTELKYVTVVGLGDENRVYSLLSRIAPLRYVETSAKSMKAMFTPNDTFYLVRQWAPQQIEANLAWDVTLGSNSIVVAVLDTGVDYNHVDLSANIWDDGSGYHGYDFVNSDTDPMDDQNQLLNPTTLICEPNEVYHGTHIAGIIGAVTNNQEGIAGLAQVKIMAVKVLDSCGQGFIDEIVQGMRYAVDYGAHIIVLSLGGSNTGILRDATKYAWDRGVVIVAASGNSNTQVAYPAAYPTAIAVGSTNQQNILSSFSNYGSQQELVAPGENIHAPKRTSPYYQSHSGTSQSAPQVAGVAALMLSRNPSLTNVDVRTIMNATATDLGEPGWDIRYGHGLVNAHRAVLQALPGGLNASIVDVSKVEGITGTPTVIPARLKSLNGSGIPGRTLDFYVDSSYVGSAITDLSGIANFTYTLPSQWGTLDLLVRFTGDTVFAQSSDRAVIEARVINGGNISGVVMDSKTYDRLPFVTISIPAGNVSVLTDDEGEFTINGIPEGTWMIIADYIGYEKNFQNVTVEAGRTTVIPILMQTSEYGPFVYENFPITAFIVTIAFSLIMIVLFLVVYSASKSRVRATTRPPPPEIPPHIASWMMYTHGIDASRFMTIEVMPVAEGHQITLIEMATGNVIVIRIDKYGRPVNLTVPPGYS